MTPRQHAVSLLKFTRHITLDILKGIPDDKFAHQRSPADNHPAWVLAHLAMTDAWIGGLLSVPGIKIPDGWDKLAGQGSKPTSNLKQYPAPSELRTVFESTRAALLNFLEACPDSALQGDLKEKTGGFATDPIDGLFKIAWHEGWHMGQVATLRKDLGLPPVMG
jgi:hypothetical protein